MNSNLFIVIAAQAIFYGTPLFFAALGGVFTERSGVLNLGVEGMMLVGGVTGAWASIHVGGSPWFTLLVAMLMAMAASFANIWKVAEDPVTRQVRKLDVLGLGDTPVLGPLLFNHTILTYMSWVMCAVASWYLFRTKIGLQLRAVGESPQTADAMGINVVKYRYIHTMLGGALAGLGGAFYSLAIVPTWVDGMTKGAGWIAIALVIFGFWRPGLTLLGAYLFGALQSLGTVLKSRSFDIPGDVLDALPFVMTIVVLVLVSTRFAHKRIGAPAALGVPYEREER
jgi:simple sugar transport system permease protein